MSRAHLNSADAFGTRGIEVVAFATEVFVQMRLSVSKLSTAYLNESLLGSMLARKKILAIHPFCATMGLTIK